MYSNSLSLIYVLYKSKNILTLVTIGYSWYIDEYRFMGPRGHFYPCMYHVMDILHCLGQEYAGTVFG